MHTLRHHPLLRRLIGVMLLALLLAQGTALVHAVAHASGGATTALAGVGDRSGQGTPRNATAPSGHWGHPAGAPQCQFFEGLLLGQAPGTALPPLALPDLRQPPTAAPRPVRIAQRAPHGYQARAPPRG